MSDINKDIAKWMGWTFDRYNEANEAVYIGGRTVRIYVGENEWFTDSLYACDLFEADLFKWGLHEIYVDHINEITQTSYVSDFGNIVATPEQRCEAWRRTINE